MKVTRIIDDFLLYYTGIQMHDTKMADDTINFVENASRSNKSFSHNKYQLQIIDLTQQIHNLDSLITAKNVDLELFKHNIQDLQLDIQDKNATLLVLTESLDKATTALQCKTVEAQLLQVSYDEILKTSKANLKSFTDEKTKLHNDISNMQLLSEAARTKYDELKAKYQIANASSELKSSDHATLQVLHKNTLQELNLEKDLTFIFKTKLDTITTELYSSQNESANLRKILHEKDAYLRDLNRRYANEKPLADVLEIQEETCKEECTVVVESGQIKCPIKTGTQRGIRSLNKGLK